MILCYFKSFNRNPGFILLENTQMMMDENRYVAMKVLLDDIFRDSISWLGFCLKWLLLSLPEGQHYMYILTRGNFPIPQVKERKHYERNNY